MYSTSCRCNGREDWNSVTLRCEECGEAIPLDFALQQIDNNNRGE